MRYVRYFAIILVGILVLLFVAGVVFIKTLDLNQYREMIAGQVKAATGRDFAIEGDIDLKLSLSPAIMVNNVRLANASWATGSDMVRMKSMAIQVQLIPLLSREVRVDRIVLIDPDIFIETDAKGKGNWVFATGVPTEEKLKEPAAAPILPIVRNLAIKNGTFRYRDGGSGEEKTLALRALAVQADEGQDVFKVDLDAVFENYDILLSGDLAIKPSDPMAGLTLNNIKVRLGRTDLAGRLDVDLKKDVPQIKAVFTSQLIDLNELLPSRAALETKPEKAKSAAKNARLFSSETLDLSLLKKANADVDFRCEKLVYKKLVLEKLVLKALLADGNFRLKPLSASLGNGVFTADLGLDAGGRIPKLSLVANGDRLPVGSLTRDMEITDLFEGGDVKLEIRVNGTGRTVREMMAGLNGKLLTSAVEVQINNSAVNFAGADLVTELIQGMNPFAKKEDFTLMKCAVLHFGVQDGIVRNDKGIGMETEKMNISGGGVIDLKTEQLDIVIRPKPQSGIGISAGLLADMVRLQGTLADPRLAMDKAGVAKKAASLGLALSTGGMSLLGQALVGKVTADSSPCKTALGEVK